jgi:hypothetical protein
MTTSAIVPAYARLPFWREILDRAGRNALQTVIPVLVAGQVGTVVGLDPINILWAAFVAAFVTVLKAVAGLKATPEAPLVWRLLDRAGPAAAATLLSFVTINGTDAAPVVDWRAALIATASAALLAIAQAYVSPAVTVIKGEYIGRGVHDAGPLPR